MVVGDVCEFSNRTGRRQRHELTPLRAFLTLLETQFSHLKGHHLTDKKRISVAPSRFRLTAEDGADGSLIGTACNQCGAHFFGSLVFCQSCSSSDMRSVELSKTGSLYSYTIVRAPPAGWQGDVPYALGQVQTEEGPHVISEIVDTPFDEIRVGMELELTAAVGGQDSKGNDLIVYKWKRPDTAAHS